MGCAGEVSLIFRELAEAGYNLVIAFFPLRCQTPVFNGSAKANEWLIESNSNKQKKLIVTLDTETQKSDPWSELRQAAKSRFADMMAMVEWLEKQGKDSILLSTAIRSQMSGWGNFGKSLYDEIAEIALGQSTKEKSGKRGIQLHRD